MFNRFRTSVSPILVLLLLPCFVLSQTVQFLPPFQLEARNEDRIQAIGKMGSFYYLYHHSPGKFPELLVLNDTGALVKTQPLEFIQPGLASSVNILLQESTMNLVVQEVKGNKHFVKIETLNRDGAAIKPPEYIDSTDFQQYGMSAYYRTVSSPNKKHFLLYRIVSGFSSIQILFNGIVLNEVGEKISSSFFYLPFNSEMETIGNIFLTDLGKLVLPIHDKHDNFKLGTTLKLYYSSLKSQPPVMMDFYLKENKPAELLLDWDESKNRLALGGLYYSFYSRNIEGAMTLFIDLEKKSLDTIIYMPLEKSFKKQLKHRIYNIPSKDVVNSLRIRYFDINKKGELNLLADLFTNAALYGKMPVNLPPNPDLPSSNRQAYYRPVPVGSANSPLQERDISNYFNSTNAPVIAPTPPRIFNNERNTATTNTNPLSGGTRSAGNNLSGRPVANERNFTRNQTDILNNTAGNTKQVFDAGNLAATNKTLNYKSVLFYIDSIHHQPKKSWVQNFFVPGTEFSNIIVVPGEKGLGLVNYELNAKNLAYLNHHRFASDGSVLKQAIASTTDPMLFYKRSSVLYDKDKLLSLYVDPQTGKLGLALVQQ